MNEDHKIRQSGRTTRQMRGAPNGSVYVWPFIASINYPKSLARNIGRDDLDIISECQLRMDRFKGKTPVDVVVDHATEVSREGAAVLDYLWYRLKARG